MKRNFANPFGTPEGPSENGDKSLPGNATEEVSELPERGTGLETGAAREERGEGISLTDEERSKRHTPQEIKDPFVTISVDGKVLSRKETYHKELLNSVPKTREEEWAAYYAKKRAGG